MVHDPPVLILDEPTAGVDIELRQQLWAYVRTLHASGVTVVLTTHYLEEAEALCDRIAIVDGGRIVADEDTPTLLARAQEKTVLVTVDRDLDAAPPVPNATRTELTGARTVTVGYDKRRTQAGAVLAAFASAGLGVVDVSTREADLEDVFLALTARHA
jgi:ABC-2 type transport system ATP-binding protein